MWVSLRSGRQVWQAWETVAPRARQLYLYSDTDALIPPSEVHRFMALQARSASQQASQQLFSCLLCAVAGPSMPCCIDRLPCAGQTCTHGCQSLFVCTPARNACMQACSRIFLLKPHHCVLPMRCMRVQEARGVAVSSRMFAGSAHVAHYRQYPEEYMAELDRFMGGMPQAAPAA